LADYFRDSREETLAQVERILAAVRPEERTEPKRLGPSERARIVAESGVPVADVDRFFAGFERLRVRMRELAGMGFFQRLGVVFGGAGLVVLLPWLLVVALLVARLAGW
jgi:signal recognition particle GTPase